MKLFKFSLLSAVLVLTFFISTVTLAEVTAPEPAAATPGTVVAHVNILDARLISQEKNVFTINFTIANGEGMQTGVKYGVQLVKDGTSYVADEKVYDEVLSLTENSQEKKEIVYTAPEQFSGNYTLYIVSNNESSFPFGVASVGKVKLTAVKKGITIDPASCYLQVVGDKTAKHYTLTSGIDITTNESLSLTCMVANETGAEVNLIPVFETKYFGSFGKNAPQTAAEAKTFSFTKNQKKTISVTLPKGTTPQFYGLKFSLRSADATSNNIYANYIVSGVSATVQKVSLDKNYYKTNEEGKISLIWSASAGNFTRSNTASQFPKLTLNAKIIGDKDRSCVSAIDQPLTYDPSVVETSIAFTTKSTCLNPTVSVSISDAKGTVLDAKNFTFTSTGVTADEDSKEKAGQSVYIILGIVVLLILVGVGVTMRKKKDPTITNSI